MFKRILVPFDATPKSTRVLHKALSLAQKFKAKVTIVHILPYTDVKPITISPNQLMGPGSLQDLPIAIPSKAEEEQLTKAAYVLQEAQSISSEYKCEFKLAIRRGEIVKEILKMAQKDYDLIVITGRKVPSIRKILLGGIASRVVQDAPCSVLVIRIEKPKPDEVPSQPENQPDK